jgi:hypothetical protein
VVLALNKSMAVIGRYMHIDSVLQLEIKLEFLFFQDALRLYMINSPVVRAESLRFKRSGVYSVVS